MIALHVNGHVQMRAYLKQNMFYKKFIILQICIMLSSSSKLLAAYILSSSSHNIGAQHLLSVTIINCVLMKALAMIIIWPIYH